MNAIQAVALGSALALIIVLAFVVWFSKKGPQGLPVTVVAPKPATPAKKRRLSDKEKARKRLKLLLGRIDAGGKHYGSKRPLRSHKTVLHYGKKTRRA